MNPKHVEHIFNAWRTANPEPKTELIYGNAFELLIAVVLSAQSTDKGVNKATVKLFADANTPEAILALGLEGLIEYVKTIGLYNNKAKNIIALCEILINQHNSEVPNTREALEALPGVGRKTANVILNTAFGQPTMAVDTHVFRLGNRTGLAPGKTPLAVEKELLDVIPESYMQHAHHWLILHGRYVCKAKNPLCGECGIRTWCEFKDKTA